MAEQMLPPEEISPGYSASHNQHAFLSPTQLATAGNGFPGNAGKVTGTESGALSGGTGDFNSMDDVIQTVFRCGYCSEDLPPCKPNDMVQLLLNLMNTHMFLQQAAECQILFNAKYAELTQQGLPTSDLVASGQVTKMLVCKLCGKNIDSPVSHLKIKHPTEFARITAASTLQTQPVLSGSPILAPQQQGNPSSPVSTIRNTPPQLNIGSPTITQSYPNINVAVSSSAYSSNSHNTAHRAPHNTVICYASSNQAQHRPVIQREAHHNIQNSTHISTKEKPLPQQGGSVGDSFAYQQQNVAANSGMTRQQHPVPVAQSENSQQFQTVQIPRSLPEMLRTIKNNPAATPDQSAYLNYLETNFCADFHNLSNLAQGLEQQILQQEQTAAQQQQRMNSPAQSQHQQGNSKQQNMQRFSGELPLYRSPGTGQVPASRMQVPDQHSTQPSLQFLLAYAAAIRRGSESSSTLRDLLTANPRQNYILNQQGTSTSQTNEMLRRQSDPISASAARSIDVITIPDDPVEPPMRPQPSPQQNPFQRNDSHAVDAATSPSAPQDSQNVPEDVKVSIEEMDDTQSASANPLRDLHTDEARVPPIHSEIHLRSSLNKELEILRDSEDVLDDGNRSCDSDGFEDTPVSNRRKHSSTSTRSVSLPEFENMTPSSGSPKSSVESSLHPDTTKATTESATVPEVSETLSEPRIPQRSMKKRNLRFLCACGELRSSKAELKAHRRRHKMKADTAEARKLLCPRQECGYFAINTDDFARHVARHALLQHCIKTLRLQLEHGNQENILINRDLID